MFIIWGFGKKTVKEFGELNESNCGYCNNNVRWKLVKITTWFTLFFIPIIPYHKEYLVVCPVCRNGKSLKKDEFMDLANGQGSLPGLTETQANYLRETEEARRRSEME